jgi:hypothetical protein
MKQLARRASLVVVLLLLPLASISAANPAHSALAKLSTGDRNERLTAFMQQSGEVCAVKSSFFQGLDSRGTAYWNVRCSDGRGFLISVSNDAQGSTKILNCAL